MTRKFLEDLGLEKESIDKIVSEHGKGIEELKGYKGQAETFKTQLDDVTAKLNAFDGVDLDSLKGEIDTLKNDLATKETDFKNQLADRDFNSLISGIISETKGKNPKAITALLDLESLKSSKNQKDDITAAIKALGESDAYLFDVSSSDNDNTPAKISTGGIHSESENTNTDPFIAAAMKGAGLNTEKE